jgi:diguanylate cyclase (GGDEF)-like protein
MYLTGILQTIGLLILSCLFNVFIRVGSLTYNLDGIVFTMFALLSSAFIFCFLGGPGKLVRGTLVSISTWGYGLALVATTITDIYIVQYVSGTEAGLFSRWAVPFCILLSYLILKRKMSSSDIFALITISAGAFYMIYIQAPENRFILIILGLILSLSMAVKFLIPELHKENVFAQKFGDIRLKIRVIGFALLSTSSLFILTVFSLVLLKELNFESLSFLNNEIIPDASIFKDYPSMISGIIWGLIFGALIEYFLWSASYKINAETVLVILSLIPITTLGLEYGLSFFPIFDINMSTFSDGHGIKVLYIVILMTLGAGMSAYMKSYKKIKASTGETFWQKVKNSSKIESQKLSISYGEANLADYEIVKNTVDFYEGDMQKASNILELPTDTILTLLNTKNSYSLRDDVSKKVHEIFRNKIFYLDQLTGVENKKGLIRQFAEYKEQNIDFNLYYMDINKFKSINDTLGHDIGDVAIITSVHRIRDYAKNNQGFAYRLGGDEFAMLTTSSKNEETVIAEIKEIINQPIDYDEAGRKGTINPSISIGKANIIKDSDIKIKDLIKSADENMYKDKKK